MDYSSDGLIEDLAAHLVCELSKVPSIFPSMAEEIAVRISENVRASWGGQALYFPSGVSKKRATRDQSIFEEFNGKNYRDLSAKYGLSNMRVRQIIYRQVALFRGGEIPWPAMMYGPKPCQPNEGHLQFPEGNTAHDPKNPGDARAAFPSDE